MKIKLFFLMLLISFSTVSVVGQGIIKREKCKTCGKVISLCPYKGKHPKPKPKQETKPKTQPKPALKPRPVLYDKTFTVKGVSFTMKPVEGGTFTMGATPEQQDPKSNEKPTHQVTLSSYYIGETEVTQALWTAVMGNTVEQIAEANGRKTWGVGKDYPMYDISWNDCQKFIEKLNSLTGKKFCLPTEAEWEYAARGGNKSRGYQYSGSNYLDYVAWYDDNSGSETLYPVKTKQPNELGIYDMSGNVWEWCQDWYDSYNSGSQTNPKGPSSGLYRVIRGGGSSNIAGWCRSAFRSPFEPDFRDYVFGLRLVLSE